TLLLAMVLLNGSAYAQSASPASPASSAETADVVTNYGSQRVLLDVARRTGKSAPARESTDPLRARSLSEAAHLFAYAGRPGHARKLLEKSADAALQRGDIVFAADALLKAALLAQQANDGAAGLRLVARIEALAT